MPVIVGAGWDPGAFPLVRRLFEVLIPHGRSETTSQPGVALHHWAADHIPGVKEALVGERRTVDGRIQRYVYVKLDTGASLPDVEQSIVTDPLYVGEETFVFSVDDMAALERPGSGIVLMRYGTGSMHQSLIMESRFDVAAFAAQAMLDAARTLGWVAPGVHRYSLSMDCANGLGL